MNQTSVDPKSTAFAITTIREALMRELALGSHSPRRVNRVHVSSTLYEFERVVEMFYELGIVSAVAPPEDE